MLVRSTNFARSLAKYFTKSHEWIDINGKVGTVGITSYGAHHLGDIVFVDVHKDRHLKAGDEVADIESVKATTPMMSPLAGKVKEVNPVIADSPEVINKAPELDGWILKLELDEPVNTSVLLDESAYKKFLGSI